MLVLGLGMRLTVRERVIMVLVVVGVVVKARFPNGFVIFAQGERHHSTNVAMAR